MGAGATWVGALVLGFAGGCLGWFVCAGPSDSASSAGGDGGGETSQASSLARLEARVDALATAVRGVRGDVGRVRSAAGDSGARHDGGGDAARPDGEAGVAAPAGDASTTTSPDAMRALEERVAALERGGRLGAVVPADLSKLSTSEMSALVGTLQSEKRFADALRVADEYARRGTLTADERTAAELQAGYALRSLGRHAEAESRFRDTLARVGESSDKASEVLFQIAWQRHYQADAAGASAEMERVANAPRASPVLVVHGLYNAGRFAIDSGDTARARMLLERLVRDHASDIPASQAFLRTEAERMLKEIAGR